MNAQAALQQQTISDVTENPKRHDIPKRTSQAIVRKGQSRQKNLLSPNESPSRKRKRIESEASQSPLFLQDVRLPRPCPLKTTVLPILAAQMASLSLDCVTSLTSQEQQKKSRQKFLVPSSINNTTVLPIFLISSKTMASYEVNSLNQLPCKSRAAKRPSCGTLINHSEPILPFTYQNESLKHKPPSSSSPTLEKKATLKPSSKHSPLSSAPTKELSSVTQRYTDTLPNQPLNITALPNSGDEEFHSQTETSLPGKKRHGCAFRVKVQSTSTEHFTPGN